MSTRAQLVLAAALRLLRPLVQVLIRQGVAYPALAAALKPVFVQAARDELAARGRAASDSALTLMSGVHRRDLRQMKRPSSRQEAADGDGSRATTPPAPPRLSLAGEVVGRWLSEPGYQGADGRPRTLPRTGTPSFDSLVQAVSQDVRPRAMLDELLRLGVVRADDAGIVLSREGLAPRGDFEQLSALFGANLHDHLAAAAANLQGDADFLEQAVHVDEITEASAQALHQAAAVAWRDAMRVVLQRARERFDADALGAAPEARRHRARFGVYFYSEREDEP